MNNQTPILNNDSRTEKERFKFKLAFNTIIELNKHIAKKPDIYDLINYLLMTIVGQYTICDCFICLRNPSEVSQQVFYVGSGNYDLIPVFENHSSLIEIIDNIKPGTEVIEANDIDLAGGLNRLGFISKIYGIEHFIPIFDNDIPIGIIGFGNKINNNKLNKEELESLILFISAVSPFLTNLRREYFDTFNSKDFSVIIFDKNWNLRRMNKTASLTLKQNKHRNPNKFKSNIIDIFPDPPFIDWVYTIKSEIVSSQKSFIKNLTYHDGNTELLYNVNISNIPTISSNNQNKLVIIEDITEQENNHQRFQNLQLQAERGRMISSIAHDLNNHIGLCVGALELSGNYLSKKKYDKVQKYFDMLKLQLNATSNYSKSLMTKSLNIIDKKLIDINNLISEIVDFIRTQNRFRDIRFRKELNNSKSIISIDYDQIIRLLINLINNAEQAISAKRTNDGVIEIKTCSDKEILFLSVIDNGIGIPKDKLEKLFKSGFTTKDNGHGIGLLSSYNIIKNHNANVSVDSEINQGTCITVEFPI